MVEEASSLQLSKRSRIEFSLDEIEGLDYSSLLEKFDLMTEADGIDSEAEACINSDAEDGFPIRSLPRKGTPMSTRTSSSDEGTTPTVSPASSGVSTPHSLSDDEIDDEPIPATIFKCSGENDDKTSSEEDNLDEKDAITWTKSRSEKIEANYSKQKFDQPFGAQVPIDINIFRNIFFLFFNLHFAQLIIDQSELYASQMGHTFKFSVKELNAFLGILIIMGMNQLPSMKMYWSSNRHFRNQRIVEIMGQKRFLMILRMLHINDNSKMPRIGEQRFDKLYKLRPMLEHFSERFREVYKPSRFLSVDESMIPFKGRSSFKQYVPMKPIKRGFKIFVMCCAVTGYMVSFDFYAGKNPNPTGEEKGPLGERILSLLTTGFENMGYCLYFDRFFSSIIAAINMLKKGFFVCATILQTRKFFPKDEIKADKVLSFGESDFAVSKKLPVGVTKWKDRGTKTVCIVSTKDDPNNAVEISRQTKAGKKAKVFCPKPVSEYNKYMGGVDKFDQYMAYYSIQWKSRRWWVKGFYYFVDACIVNSYILYKEAMKKEGKKAMSHLSFRSQLAEELIDGWCSKKTIVPKVLVTRKKFGPKERALVMKTEGHLPVKGTKRRCALCSTKKNPKRSNLACLECKVALCKVPCFKDFHEQMSSK